MSEGLPSANDQWFVGLCDFVEEGYGSMSGEQRDELWRLAMHVPRRSESGDLWYRRFSEEAVKNLKLTKEIERLSSAPTGLTREWLDEMIDGLFEPEGDDGDYQPDIRKKARLGAEMLRDLILESSSAPTPEMES
jgi:hypothetical protein